VRACSDCHDQAADLKIRRWPDREPRAEPTPAASLPAGVAGQRKATFSDRVRGAWDRCRGTARGTSTVGIAVHCVRSGHIPGTLVQAERSLRRSGPLLIRRSKMTAGHSRRGSCRMHAELGAGQRVSSGPAIVASVLKNRQVLGLPGRGCGLLPILGGIGSRFCRFADSYLRERLGGQSEGRPAMRQPWVASQGDLLTMRPRQLGTGMSVTTARQALLGSLFGSPATAQLPGDTA
jgi:hypothetical protein